MNGGIIEANKSARQAYGFSAQAPKWESFSLNE